MRLVCILMLAVASMFGQNILTVQSTTSSGRVGSTWTANIQFQATAAVAAMQFTVDLPTGISGLAIATPLDRLEAGTAKQITCAGTRCVISGSTNVAQIAAGVVATVTGTIETTAPGPHNITVSAMEFSGPTGQTVPATAGAPFVLTVLPSFDVNGDGSINADDYAALLSQVVPGPCTPAGDLNQDGSCSVKDLVLMTRAILGL